MPIIRSAKKRVRVARKATVRNVKTKRNLKTALKAFQTSINGGKKSPESLNSAISALDKAGKKRVLHKNKVARKKRQLAKQAKAAGVKPAAKAKTSTSTAKKTAKPAAKKTSAKKPAVSAKKAAPKKSTSKK
jgi:small subunit ribosomal protein S20